MATSGLRKACLHESPGTSRGESSAGAGESFAGAGESSAGAGESSAGAGEPSAGAGELSAGAGESSAGAGEPSAGAGEPSAGAGESSAGAGESSAGTGESSTGDFPFGKTLSACLLLNPLVEDGPGPFKRDLSDSLQQDGERLGRPQEPLGNPQSFDQVGVEQLQILYHLAAVAGLDGEAFRSGILLKMERRVPPGAREDGRRQQSQPPLPQHRRRPVPAPGGFAATNRLAPRALAPRSLWGCDSCMETSLRPRDESPGTSPWGTRAGSKRTIIGLIALALARGEFMSRNYICSSGWVVVVALLCAVFLAPERSAACSCVVYFRNWGFVSDGGLIPSNSRGLLWWGKFSGSTGKTDQGPPVLIAGASGELLPVEYELVSKDPPQGLWLFRPRDGFKTGESYVFHTRRTHTLGGEEQRINVTVSDQAAASPAGPVTLKVGEPITGALQIAAGVSCGASVNAVQLPVEMDLPAAMSAFRDQLYFETIIDGTLHWGPSDSACTTIVPGASWRGKGADLLFSICGDKPPFAFEGLAEGRHTVEMRASLPGTDFLAVTSKVEVELRCTREPDNADRGPAIRNVDLQAYCAKRSFTGVRNLDGTGYGWRCTPGDANIDVNQACAEQHGGNFAAQLLSKPPGGPDDWRCERIYTLNWDSRPQR